jgi:hypothetical protein
MGMLDMTNPSSSGDLIQSNDEESTYEVSKRYRRQIRNDNLFVREDESSKNSPPKSFVNNLVMLDEIEEFQIPDQTTS